MDGLSRQKRSAQYTDLDRFVNNIERNRPFVYIEKVLDLWVQLIKNGGKNKCCVYNFVQCILNLFFRGDKATFQQQLLKFFVSHDPS